MDPIRPKISLILPSYNRAALIAETLSSIRSQTFQDWECLVVDDRSTDETLDVVRSFADRDARFRHVVKPADLEKGPSRSRNLGFQSTRSEYVMFFDSDDILEPNVLESALDRMDRESLDFFAMRIRWFNGDEVDSPFESSGLFEAEDFVARGVAAQHAVWTQNIIWRRSFLVGSPGFRTELHSLEDLEFGVRNMSRTSKFGFSNDLWIRVRRHPSSLTFDESPEARSLRSIGAYDSLALVNQHIQRIGQATPEAMAFVYRNRYNAISDLTKRGIFSWALARRYLHMIASSAKDRRARPFFRLTLLAPVFLGIGLVSFARRRLLAPPP